MGSPSKNSKRSGEDLILEHLPGIAGILEAGEDGEGKGEPEERGHQPRIGMSKPGEGNLGESKGIQEEPHEGGDTEADLEAGLPFAAPVRRNDLALFDRNLPQARYEELAGENDYDHPDRAEVLLMGAKKNEGRGREHLVGNGVEQFSEGSDKSHSSSKISVQEISDRGGDKGEERDAIAHPVLLHESDDEHCGQNQA